MDRYEPKPKRNPENYTVKAQIFGYRGGERHQFEAVERQITSDHQEVLFKLPHFKAFRHVKCILDSKPTIIDQPRLENDGSLSYPVM